MHDQMTEVLGEEVVGPITRRGDQLLDVGLGRVCLPRLEPQRVAELVAAVQEAFGGDVAVDDQLHLSDPQRLLRGLVQITVRQPGGGEYLLQLTSEAICSFYERRFALGPDQLGDLMGSFCQGVARVGATDAPLRLLCGLQRLQQLYRQQLDAAVQAAVAGELPPEQGQWVAPLVQPMRRAWGVIPWPLRQQLTPVSQPAGARTAAHDEVLKRTVLLGTSVQQGEVLHQHTHLHHPLERYPETLGWMLDLRDALQQTYEQPAHEVLVARASSAQRLLATFPGLQQQVNSTEPGT